MKQILLFSVITFLCFLLCGCDADYKMNIDQSLNVNEEISGSYDLNLSPDVDYDKASFEDLKSQAEASNYEVIDSSTASKLNVTFKRKSSLEGFKSPVFDDIYTYFYSGCDESKCSIISTAKKTDVEGDGTFVNYKISITVPYKVLKQNADKIDLKNNTYIWYYIVGGKQSDIQLVFEKQGKNVIEINKRNSDIKLIVIGIISAIVIGLIGRVIYRIIKNSRPN